MPNFNRVILMGHLTRDPELRAAQSGQALVKFSIAVNDRYKDREKVNFFDCTAFGKLAEIIGEHMHKGKPIHIEGRLDHETWETKEGQKRSKVGIIVESMQFIPQGEKRGGGRDGGGKPKTQRQDPPPMTDEQMDDCPF